MDDAIVERREFIKTHTGPKHAKTPDLESLRRYNSAIAKYEKTPLHKVKMFLKGHDDYTYDLMPEGWEDLQKYIKSDNKRR